MPYVVSYWVFRFPLTKTAREYYREECSPALSADPYLLRSQSRCIFTWSDCALHVVCCVMWPPCRSLSLSGLYALLCSPASKGPRQLYCNNSRVGGRWDMRSITRKKLRRKAVCALSFFCAMLRARLVMERSCTERRPRLSSTPINEWTQTMHQRRFSLGLELTLTLSSFRVLRHEIS